MMDVLIMAGVAAAIVVLGVIVVVFRRRPRTLKTVRFQEKWRALQKLCASKDTWKQAIVEADQLLDEALRKRHYSGKSMGERLTKAQRVLSDNEGVWFGHKLRTKLENEVGFKLKETDVKQALMAIRQALKDLGALPDGK